MRIVGLLVRHLVNFDAVRWSILGACSHLKGRNGRFRDRLMSKISRRGTYQCPTKAFRWSLSVMQRSVAGDYHYGILDIGNRLGVRRC